LGGGLPRGSVTDVFGAAGTGKTQIAFQTCYALFFDFVKQKEERRREGGGEEEEGKDLRSQNEYPPRAVFIDCLGSFRPERIAEIARARGTSKFEDEILKSIFLVRARSVSKMKDVTSRLCEEEEEGGRFNNCRLLVVDDVTSNFISETGRGEEGLMRRQSELALYIRELAFLARIKDVAVLITNSVRSSGDKGTEVEATGRILSMYSLYRLHLGKRGKIRFAKVVQPLTRHSYSEFEIRSDGIP
jgi:DNA repair protein RadA